MHFKHPELLYTLFALLIPILVHLFQLRRFQKLAFTNVQFLRAIRLQTRKSSRIKKWLVLIARLLAMAALILAFAQPFFAAKAALVSDRETVLYLDNSFSMEAQGANGPLFKRAVQELLSTIPDNEKITVFTNDQLYRHTTTKDSKTALSSQPYSSRQLSYSAALFKAKQLFSRGYSGAKRIVMVSDFQQKEAAFPEIADSTGLINLVQMRPVSAQNLAIDSLYLSKNSIDELTLHVQLQNYGDKIAETPVGLYNKNNLVAKTSVHLEPNSKGTTNFSLQSQTNFSGEVRIEDANLQFDNSKYFNISKPKKVKVLGINSGDATFLERIFTPTAFALETTAYDQLDYNKIANADCIFLNELKTLPIALQNALRNFVQNGGVLCLIPSVDGDAPMYTQFLSTYGMTLESKVQQAKKITRIHFGHPLYQGVFEGKISNFQYPTVSGFFPNQGGEAILSYENDTPFLINQDNVYVFTAAISEKNSNFKNAPLVVPTLYNIGKSSLKLPELYYTLGNKNSYAIATRLEPDEILSLVKGTSSIIPQQQSYSQKVLVTTTDTPELAGIYGVQKGDSIISQVTYNYDTSESRMRYHDMSILPFVTKDGLSELLARINASNMPKELWKWFVIFALLFLVIEQLVLKFVK